MQAHDNESAECAANLPDSIPHLDAPRENTWRLESERELFARRPDERILLPPLLPDPSAVCRTVVVVAVVVVVSIFSTRCPQSEPTQHKKPPSDILMSGVSNCLRAHTLLTNTNLISLFL